jgi:hypothetical protein
MIYRGPDFLAVKCFGSLPSPPPCPPSTVSKLDSTGYAQEDVERETTCWRERGDDVGEEGATSYDGEKAWSSINHSIVSGTFFFLYTTSPMPVF